VVDTGKTDSTITAPLLKAPRANVSEGKLSVNADRQDEIPSSNFDGTAVPVQAKANPERLASDGQFNMTKQHGESLREPADLQLGEESLTQLDPSSARSAPVQPDVSVMASQRHENIANDNATTAWRPVVDRVAQEIKAHIELGKHEAIIQLDPPELGKIKIDLRLDGDRLQARIVTEEGHTKLLIESHLTELRQALETGQLDLRNIRVDRQDAPSAGGQWAEGFRDAQGQGEGQGQSRGDAGGGEPMFNDSAQIDNSQRRQIDGGRISMWA
jgi:flagellar hook-length control protein FliK